MGNSRGSKKMPKKRNTCQEIPSVWRKTSSTLLSRPAPIGSQTFQDRWCPTISRTRKEPVHLHQRGTTYGLLWPTPYSLAFWLNQYLSISQCPRHNVGDIIVQQSEALALKSERHGFKSQFPNLLAKRFWTSCWICLYFSFLICKKWITK